MKIQGADLRNTKNRIPLQDVFPLDTPMSVYIEPTNLCNIRCQFCPTGNFELIKQVGRKQGVMTWDTFNKMITQLKEFKQKIKIINFYKDGEPLVNKHYPEMARILKNSGVCEQMWVKTNGLLLNPDVSDRLINSNFDMIGISVIAPHADGYKRIADISMDYDKFVNNIRYLFEHGNSKIYIKMANVNFEQWEIEKFYNDFENICDYIAIENLHGWSRTDLKDFTLGSKPETFDGVVNTERIVCAWPLYQMAINWNGLVQPCNEDWSWNNIMGDINSKSLVKIWNGSKFNEFRKMHLRGERFQNKACGNCWQTMSCLDNVDSYREELLERIE